MEFLQNTSHGSRRPLANHYSKLKIESLNRSLAFQTSVSDGEVNDISGHGCNSDKSNVMFSFV